MFINKISVLSILVLFIFHVVAFVATISENSNLHGVFAQVTTTTAPPSTTTTTLTLTSTTAGNTTSSAPAASTTTTSTTASSTVTGVSGNGTNSGNGTTAAPAAAPAETQTLQWYHVAVAVAIGFLLAFGTCYAVCVWQQTAVRDYEGDLENFLKEVGLLRRQLADEVEEREEMQAKTGTSNALFDKYKAEQEAIQAEAAKKEALRKNLADVGGHGGTDDPTTAANKPKDGKGKDGGNNADGAAAPNRTQNMISFKQQRAQEIKNLQALSRIGTPLGVVGGAGSTGRLVPELQTRYGADPRFGIQANRVNALQQQQERDLAASGRIQPTLGDPLQMALADALNTQRVLNSLRGSAQMRSLATQSEL